MAVTPGGNFYIESSDLVANYPATSLAIANRLDKYALNPYTDATERDFLIQFPVQGQLAQTLDDNKAWKYDGTAWAPFSSAGPANFTDAATGTYTDGGVDYKYLTVTGTQSVTFDRAGFASVLVIGGGGGGGLSSGGGGGAGSHLEIGDAFLAAATHIVTVGAGGAGGFAPGPSIMNATGNNGIASSVAGVYYSPGGGGGGTTELQYGNTTRGAGDGLNGGSGGGAGGGDIPVASGGAGITGLGFAGGAGNALNGSGGGGGASAVGADQSGTIGGDGGAGKASSITGASVTRAGGGGGSGLTNGSGGSGGGGAGGNTVGVAGAANLGAGGGGTQTVGSTGAGAGGSGIVIIRVVV